MRWIYFTFLIALAGPGFAETVVPAQVIRAKSLITEEAVVLKAMTITGTYGSVDEVVGMEARIALYPGRPIRLSDIGPPALIERNQIVQLVFENAGLHISVEGRSLSRAAAGEMIKVMNLASRTTVSGYVLPDSTVRVRR